MAKYLLTRKQFLRRTFGIGFVAASGWVGIQMQRNYMLSRGDNFSAEYALIKDDVNFYHTLHE